MPPINDNVANAIPLTTDAGHLTFSNIGATEQADEPAYVNSEPTNGSVWFKYTAPADGRLRVGTFDTPLPVWDSYVSVVQFTAWPDITQWTEVGSDDDGHLQAGQNVSVDGPYGTSEVFFLAYAGQTYYIRVDQFDGTQRDDLVLTWQREIGGAWGGLQVLPNAPPDLLYWSQDIDGQAASKKVTQDGVQTTAAIDACYATARAGPPATLDLTDCGVITSSAIGFFGLNSVGAEVSWGYQGFAMDATPLLPPVPPEAQADPTLPYQFEGTSTYILAIEVHKLINRIDPRYVGGSLRGGDMMGSDVINIYALTRAQANENVVGGVPWVNDGWTLASGVPTTVTGIGLYGDGTAPALATVGVADSWLDKQPNALNADFEVWNLYLAYQTQRVATGAVPDYPPGLGTFGSYNASDAWLVECRVRLTVTAYPPYRLWQPGTWAPFQAVVGNLTGAPTSTDLEFTSHA